MLSLNRVSISSYDEEILNEIFIILNKNSVDYDVNNYHLFTKESSKFISLFFNIDVIFDFGFDWAYIESCERSNIVTFDVYSYNGNISKWVSKLREKYLDYKLDISLEIHKSVKFKNYSIGQTWMDCKLPKIDYKKKG
jgi:hypothetical protein